MTPTDRKLAEFFARLASLRQLEGMPAADAAKLLKNMLQLGYQWLKHDDSIRARLLELNPRLAADELSAEKIGTFKQSLAAVALHELHRHARKLIGDLLAGREVEPLRIAPFRRTSIKLKLDRESRMITEEVSISRPDPQEEMLVDLVRLIRPGRCPFARCRGCPTIFVPSRKQQFCTTDCMWRHTIKRRKVTKREYMRGYMRERRSKAKSRRKA